MIGNRSPPATAMGRASRIWGTTCSGVTQLMLWQPRAWRASIIWAQAGRGHPLALDLPGDVVVLAEHTAQVAAGEEDRPRAVPAPQAVLLPEMGKVGRDHGLAADGAQPIVVGQTVHLAQPRANRTALLPQQRQRLSGARFQLVDAQPQIGRRLIPGSTHRTVLPCQQPAAQA